MRNEPAANIAGEASFAANPWTTATQIAIIGLFMIAVITALHVTRAVAVPVLLAIIVGTILAPLVTRLQRHGVPRVVSTVFIVVLLMALFVIFVVALTTPLMDWLGRASELGALLRSKLQNFSGPLSALQDLFATLQSVGASGKQGGQGITVAAAPNANIVETAVNVLTPALSQLLVFFVSIVFYLVYKTDFKASAILAFSSRETRLRILRIYNDVEQRLSRFFATFTLINIALGAVTTFAMYLVGMPNPLLWGAMAGVLNFLPYLGPAIVTIALVVASLVSFPTLAEAAVPPLIYIAVHTIEGEFLTPSVLGYRLSVNPFFLFLSVVFWTWMWGPIGAFLAVPIAMVTAGVLQHCFPPPEHPSLP
jgi:predicted PurR-regulated permease PerM